MSIWGKLAGAAAGLAVGGPIGALLGGVAGHYVIDRDQQQDGPAENQVAFTVGVIALGAKMAKADGVVTMDEVNAFKEVFKVPEGEMKNVARVFNLAKQDVAGYEAYAEQLAAMFKGNRKLLEDVLEGLFHIAKADDTLHPNEERFLKQGPAGPSARPSGAPRACVKAPNARATAPVTTCRLRRFIDGLLGEPQSALHAFRRTIACWLGRPPRIRRAHPVERDIPSNSPRGTSTYHPGGAWRLSPDRRRPVPRPAHWAS